MAQNYNKYFIENENINCMNVMEFLNDLGTRHSWIKLVYRSQNIRYLENNNLRTWPVPRRNGYYDHIRSEEEIEKFRKSVVRIEIMHNDEYYPVWTEEDGIIQLNQAFVRLNGRYYTIPFLESLIDKINDIKAINT